MYIHNKESWELLSLGFRLNRFSMTESSISLAIDSSCKGFSSFIISRDLFYYCYYMLRMSYNCSVKSFYNFCYSSFDLSLN